MPVITKQVSKKKLVKGGAARSVVDRIAPIAKPKTGLKVNIYGRSGTGKTSLACTFPKPLLLIGAEDGTMSVYKEKGVDFVHIYKGQEFSEVVDHAKGKYASVCLDTISSFYQLVMRDVLQVDELPVQNSWGEISRDDYGQCAFEVKQYLRQIFNLSHGGQNVIILAQEREYNVEAVDDLINPYVASDITEGILRFLNPEVDYLVNTFIRPKEVVKTIKINGKEKKKTERLKNQYEYCLRTGDHDVYNIKFRVPRGTKRPACIVDPTYDKMLKLINGES